MGSAGFLLIFAAVNGANVVLADDTRSKSWLSLIGVVLCLSALASLLWQTAKSSPHQLGILFVMAGAAFLIEIAFRLTTRRTINLSRAHKNKP
jgi:lipoprotein signal peptidase